MEKGRRTRHTRLVRAFAASLLLWAVAGGVRSAEEALSVDLMQTIEDTNKSLSSNIALRQVKEATSDAKELNAMFAQVEAYYQHKGDAPDAVDLAQKSRSLSADIVRQIGANDFGNATDSATTLARTCRTCHSFYKKS